MTSAESSIVSLQTVSDSSDESHQLDSRPALQLSYRPRPSRRLALCFDGTYDPLIARRSTDDEQDGEQRPTPKYEFKGHEDAINSFIFLDNNIHIVSGSEDGTMRKWNCETGLLVGEPWEGQSGAIHALALSPDGETIVCGRDDGTVERWNTDGEMIEGIWTGHSGAVRSLSWSHCGEGHIASSSDDGTILIRGAESGQVEVGPIKTNQGQVNSVAYSPFGERIASGGYNSICIWDSHTGHLLVGPIGVVFSVKSIVWSLDGKLYSADKFIHVFDSISGAPLLRLQYAKAPFCVALSPRHNLLACVGYQGIAWLLSTESNRLLGQSTHHDGQLFHVSFSPDGRYLAHGGEDHQITVWMVRDIAPEIETASPSCSQVSSTSCLTVDSFPRPQVDVTRPFARTTNSNIPNMFYNLMQSSNVGSIQYYDSRTVIDLTRCRKSSIQLYRCPSDRAGAKGEEYNLNRPQTPPSCLQVDATQLSARTDDSDEHDNIYNDFFQSSKPSRPSAAYDSSCPSQRSPVFSKRHWRPQPVTVYAMRRINQSHMDTADALSSRTMTSSESSSMPSLYSISDSSDGEEGHIIEFPTYGEPSSPGQSNQPTRKYEFKLKGQQRDVRSFVFLDDNIHIVSGSSDGTMCKWDCETGLLVGKPWEGQGGMIHALALSPDGKTIACARNFNETVERRNNGTVERWNTDGEMIEDIWTVRRVLSLSWSPSGGHIASGSNDQTILIRNAESGQVEVGPIKTKQVWSVVYSPLGDRIASAGDGSICIWDSHVGNLLVGPIQYLRSVWSIVWSLDGSRLYFAGRFVHVFDSVKGTELLRLRHDESPRCVALSPTHDLLACVGYKGLAQLWNTKSNQPLCEPFHHDRELNKVSFSPNGQYLVYSGKKKKFTLRIVKDIVPEIETLSSSCLQVDPTQPFARSDDSYERVDIYNDFFRPSEPSHPSAAYDSSRPSRRSPILLARRLWNALVPSQRRTSASESIQLHGRPKRRFLSQQAGSQPVTVSAGRKKEMYVRAPGVVAKKDGHPNAQATSSSAKPSSPTQPPSTPHMPPHPPSSPNTHPGQEEYDFGRWGNFWHAICCIQPRPRQIVSAIQPVAP